MISPIKLELRTLSQIYIQNNYDVLVFLYTDAIMEDRIYFCLFLNVNDLLLLRSPTSRTLFTHLHSFSQDASSNPKIHLGNMQLFNSKFIYNIDISLGKTCFLNTFQSATQFLWNRWKILHSSWAVSDSRGSEPSHYQRVITYALHVWLVGKVTGI